MTPDPSAAETHSAEARNLRAFATTHWSMVVQAAAAGTAEGQVALEELCRVYWTPLYGFARRHGLSAADAEDLTQGFFADLLARGAIAQADANRGRFRTFLLSSFKNFHSHQRARAGSLKRGGGHEIVSLDALRGAEAQFLEEPATTDSPEKIYDRKWAASLLAEALAALRREYAGAGKAELFDELKVVLWGGRDAVGYVEIAQRLGTSEGALRVALHRLRQRFGEHLRSEVAKTVLDPADVDDEMRYLLAALSR
jgi:RNA polymerase sigma factor (sigma-70 family)